MEIVIIEQWTSACLAARPLASTVKRYKYNVPTQRSAPTISYFMIRNRYFIALIAAILLTSGCATAKYDKGYKVAGKEFATFKDIDDENALEMMVQIYNAPVKTYPERVSRNITFETYQDMLRKRRSQYLERSGIFDVKYARVDLKKWDDNALLRTYEEIKWEDQRLSELPTASEPTESDIVMRIIRFTAMHAMAQELQGRSNREYAWGVATQTLSTAMQIAITMFLRG